MSRLRDDAIRLLTRPTRNLLPALFFAMEAVAAPCDGMLGEDANALNSKINVVASVTVNGLELADPHLDIEKLFTAQQWHRAFGGEGVVIDVSSMDIDEEMCIPRHDVTVSYPDKEIILTLPVLEPEDAKSMLEKDASFFENLMKRGSDWKALVEIYWPTGKFKDSLVVGEHVIKPNLKFDAFKKLFPLSAQNNVAALTRLVGWSKHEQSNATQTYIVEVAYEGWDVCLNQTVEFSFSKEGKLNSLALRHYHEWCGC